MTGRPVVRIKCAMSIDGCIDADRPATVVLSSPEDLEKADLARAESDAILIGAETLRKDDPRLAIRTDGSRAVRARRGLVGEPIRVVVSRSGALDPARRFFRSGSGTRLVYVPADLRDEVDRRIREVATTVGIPHGSGLDFVLADLARKGVSNLLVEGGSSVICQLVAARLVDEIEISVAPFFIAREGAPRIVAPHPKLDLMACRLRLVKVDRLGDMAVLTYAFPRDARGE